MLKKFYQISETVGVSIRITGEETDVSACFISTDGKALNFVKKITGLNDVRLLRERLPAKTVVALNLSGKGILLKQIAHLDEVTPGNFDQILPNAAYDEFYVQHFVSGENSFVALIRKKEADMYVTQLTDLGFTVAMLSLGPYPVEHILPQLNIYGEQICFNGHLITRNENKEWISYTYNKANRSPFPVKAESETLAEDLLLAYAAAFQLLLHDKVDAIYANAAGVNASLEELLADRKFKTEGSLLLIIFFVLLLTNFVLLSWLNTSNAKLLDKVGVSDQSAADMNKLNDEIAVKERLLTGLGWDGGVNKSVLVDQVAALLPDGVMLERLTINPYDKRQSELKKIQLFADRQLLITGNSAQVIPVNEWIARIKTKPWAKDVQLLSYQVDQEKNTGRFTIKISY